MIDMINSAAAAWWNWMWPMFWQVGVLIVLVAAADRLIRNRVWPQVRYALWVLVLVKLVIPPGLALPTSPISASGLLPGAAGQAVVASTDAPPADAAVADATPSAAMDEMPIAAHAASEQPSAAVNASDVTPMHWHAYIMLAWIAGVVLLSAWLILRFRYLRHAYGAGSRPDRLPPRLRDLLVAAAGQLHLKRLPDVVISEKAPGPAVFGVFRPVLLLPAEAVSEMSDDELTHVLLHELAHIKRGDLAAHACNMVLQIAYWFNPLLWMVRRQLQHIRELCCDATVGRVLKDKSHRYTQTLCMAARRLLARSVQPSMGLLGLFETPGRLEARLKWLGRSSWKHPHLRAAVAAGVVAVMLVCVLPMARGQAEDALVATAPAPPSAGQNTQDQPDARTVQVSGKVLTPEGEPISGATIKTFRVALEPEKVTVVPAGQDTTTDAEGVFRSGAAPTPKSQFLLILALKQGRALDWAVRPGVQADSIELTFRLGESHKLGGIVLDETGKPVDGVEVWAWVAPGRDQGEEKWGFPGSSVPGLSSRTGANGRFLMEGLPSWARADLVVTAAGKASAHTFGLAMSGILSFSAGQMDVKINLEPEARLEGRVVEQETGKPVSGLTLVARPLGDLSGVHLDGRFLSGFCTSGSNGQFSFSGLRQDRYEMKLPGIDSHPQWAAVPAQAKTVTGQTTKDVRLNVTRGGMLDVRVRGEAGRPVEQARVRVTATETRDRWYVSTDAVGLARFRLVPGTYRVDSLSRTGYSTLSPSRNDPGDPGLTVVYGKTQQVDFTLRKLRQIHGVVRDEAGKPVDQASVTLLGSSSRDEPVVTNVAGEFQLSEDRYPRRDEDMLLIVRQFERNLAAVVPVDEPGESAQKIVLGRAATLVGQVTTPDGRPIPDATIFLLLRSGRTGTVIDRKVRTDAQGRYRIQAVPEWEGYSVTALAEGYGSDDTTVPYPDPQQQAVTVDTIVLRPADQFVAGIVVDQNGDPVPGVAVRVSGRGQPMREQATTDPRGRFRVENVCAGDLTVFATDQRTSGQVAAKAGQDDVRVVLGGLPGF